MMLLFDIQSFDNVKNKLSIFGTKLISKTTYDMSLITQLSVIFHRFISNKIFSGYTQGLGYPDSCFNRGYLSSLIEIIIEAVLVYAGFCRQFFYEHTRVSQFGFQIFFESHTFIIVGEKA